MTHIIRYLTLAALLCCTAWVASTPNWESATAFLVALLAFLPLDYRVTHPKGRRTEGSTTSIEDDSDEHLVIHRATYGRDDKQFNVTDALRELIRENRLEVVSGNQLKGDPLYGQPKFLNVEYSFGGRRHTTTVPEGEMLRLP